MAFALYGVAVVVAPVVGPTLGGWITDNYTWRWIFFINIPVGILSLFLTSRMVEDPPTLERKSFKNSKVDVFGLSAITIGLASLQIMLDKGQREDWFSSHLIVALTVMTVVSLLFAVYWAVSALSAKRSLGATAWWNQGVVRIGIVVLVVAVLHGAGAGHALRAAQRYQAGSMWLGAIGAVLVLLGVGLAIYARIYLGRNWGMPMSRKEEPELVTGVKPRHT